MRGVLTAVGTSLSREWQFLTDFVAYNRVNCAF